MKSDLAARIAASPDAAAIKGARTSLSSAKAAKAGRKFEDELSDTHHSYSGRKWGTVRQHYPKTVVTGTDQRGPVLRLAQGGNPVDYTGHVNLCPSQGSGTGWQGCAPGATGYVRVPVEFDAKRMSTRSESYKHDEQRLHQLLDLRESAKTGTAAFILVHAVPLERVFVIGPEYFDLLIRGQRITLATKARGASAVLRIPSCAYVLGFGWNYAPLIPLACPGIMGA